MSNKTKQIQFNELPKYIGHDVYFKQVGKNGRETGEIGRAHV